MRELVPFERSSHTEVWPYICQISSITVSPESMVEEISFKGNCCCVGQGSETQNFGFINQVEINSLRVARPSPIRPFETWTFNFVLLLLVTVLISQILSLCQTLWRTHRINTWIAKYALDLPNVEMKMPYLVCFRVPPVCFVTCFVFSFLRPRAVLLFPSEPGAGREKVKLCKLSKINDQKEERLRRRKGNIWGQLRRCRTFPSQAFCVAPRKRKKRLQAVD